MGNLHIFVITEASMHERILKITFLKTPVYVLQGTWLDLTLLSERGYDYIMFLLICFRTRAFGTDRFFFNLTP